MGDTEQSAALLELAPAHGDRRGLVAAGRGVTRSSPRSPSVQVTQHRADALGRVTGQHPAVKSASSSGWAWTARRVKRLDRLARA